MKITDKIWNKTSKNSQHFIMTLHFYQKELNIYISVCANIFRESTAFWNVPIWIKKPQNIAIESFPHLQGTN